MKKILSAILLGMVLSTGVAQAAVVFQATNDAGEYINLTDEPHEKCRSYEFRALLYSKDIKRPGLFAGCWTHLDKVVHLTLDDGTTLSFPSDLFVRVAGA